MYNLNLKSNIVKLFLKIVFCMWQVKTPDAAWSDTRRSLRKDHRWESSSLLERDEKERLFNEHIEALAKKKKEHFRQLLDETTSVHSDMGHLSNSFRCQLICCIQLIQLTHIPSSTSDHFDDVMEGSEETH